MNLQFTLICVVACITIFPSHSQENNVQVLLIGSSHWANYDNEGSDVTKTAEIDILAADYQKELEEIADRIAEFGPDKIFVERPVSYQPTLDSIFSLYCTTDWGAGKRNEIFQLGFRVAKKLKHEKVYGADYLKTEFPFDSLVKALVAAQQFDMMESFKRQQMEREERSREMVANKASLKEILYFKNSDSQRKENFGWYLHGANKVGGLANDIGSHLASEWIRRNTYMYGIIQKYLEPNDDRIMVLMGSGHIAVIANLMSYNPNLEIVELVEIMGE